VIAAANAARILAAARLSGHTVEPFSDTESGLTEDWGYAVQDEDHRSRVADGERTIGAKLGLTSRAKQRRMGVDTPIVGFLTDAMLFEAARVTRELHRWVQPRIEPEIVFVTAQDISAPITLDEAAMLVDSVTVGAEILDSRFTDYRFGLGDVIADNTSAAGVLLGPPHRLDRIGALASLSCAVEVDGAVVHEAAGSAVLGDPLRSLVLLAEHVAACGNVLAAGSLVLAGAMTDAVTLRTGHTYSLRVDTLGSLDFAT
jgi:2-oxo-3-hexenedioate decarboxylase